MATITVGHVIEEFIGDDETPCDLCAYVSVHVTIDGKSVRFGTMVGVPESLHGTARDAGAGVRARCTAWQVDASDLGSVPTELRDDVKEAIAEESYRLFCEAISDREEVE